MEEGNIKTFYSLKLWTLYAVNAEERHTKTLQSMLSEWLPFQRTVLPSLMVLGLLSVKKALEESAVVERAAQRIPQFSNSSLATKLSVASSLAQTYGTVNCMSGAQGRDRIMKA